MILQYPIVCIFAASGCMATPMDQRLHMKSFEVAENLFAEINPMITSFVSAVDAVHLKWKLLARQLYWTSRFGNDVAANL
ncbi:MAG: hypothetical protein CM15mP32_1780 [Flavobacteriaceae bacterium]|nr:MAG: hypothetical protein CM15mP32_1780 [Flavobacteriaceae bacterium]